MVSLPAGYTRVSPIRRCGSPIRKIGRTIRTFLIPAEVFPLLPQLPMALVPIGGLPLSTFERRIRAGITLSNYAYRAARTPVGQAVTKSIKDYFTNRKPTSISRAVANAQDRSANAWARRQFASGGNFNWRTSRGSNKQIMPYYAHKRRFIIPRGRTAPGPRGRRRRPLGRKLKGGRRTFKRRVRGRGKARKASVRRRAGYAGARIPWSSRLRKIGHQQQSVPEVTIIPILDLHNGWVEGLNSTEKYHETLISNRDCTALFFSVSNSSSHRSVQWDRLAALYKKAMIIGVQFDIKLVPNTYQISESTNPVNNMQQMDVYHAFELYPFSESATSTTTPFLGSLKAAGHTQVEHQVLLNRIQTETPRVIIRRQKPKIHSTTNTTMTPTTHIKVSMSIASIFRLKQKLYTVKKNADDTTPRFEINLDTTNILSTDSVNPHEDNEAVGLNWQAIMYYTGLDTSKESIDMNWNIQVKRTLRVRFYERRQTFNDHLISL